MPRFLVERTIALYQTIEVIADTPEQAMIDADLANIDEDWRTIARSELGYAAELIHDGDDEYVDEPAMNEEADVE